MIFSGVFERSPACKPVIVEFELAWVPHILSKMDYTYCERHEEALYRQTNEPRSRASMSPGCTASTWSGWSRDEREKPCQTGKPTTSPSMTLVLSPSRRSKSKNPRCIRFCCTMMTSPRWNLWWTFCGTCFINQSWMPSTSCWRSTSRVWAWQGCTRMKLPKPRSVKSPNSPEPTSSHCCVLWKKNSHHNKTRGLVIA